MKFRFLMGAGLAAVLGAAVSAALAQQVTLISANGSLSCATHNGVQVSSNGAITINVGSCDLGSGTGGDGGDPGGELPAGFLTASPSTINTQVDGESTFYVSLSRPPAGNGQLSIVSNDPNVATVTGSVSFSSTSYGNRQVTVTGVSAGQTSITVTAQGADFDGKFITIPVTVTSASGGGETGPDDPGLGKKWATTYQGQNVFVVDRSAYSNRTYFPGCLSQSWSALGLNHNRTLNPLAVANVLNSCRSVSSLQAGVTYSQRVPIGSAPGTFSIKLGRAEAGETSGQLYDIAISKVPGNLNPGSNEFPTNASRCMKTGSTDASISLVGRSAWGSLSSRMQGSYCPLEENTVYYFNFRPVGTSCGKGTYVCRVQVMDDVPSHYYQDVRVKTDSY